MTRTAPWNVNVIVMMGVAVGLLLLLAGCGGGDQATPQMAFAKLKSAGESKDFGKMVEVMRPDDQAMFAFSMAFAGGMMVGMAGMGDKAKGEKLKADYEAIMKKHGLSEDKMKGAMTTAMKKKGDEAAAAAAMKKAFEGVDLGAFIGELMTFLDKIGDKKDKKKNSFKMTESFEGELTDVKIDGDKATGTVKTKDKSQPLHFERVDGKWYISMMKGKKKK